MNQQQLEKKIKELKTELSPELREHGLSKRALFLSATIEIYTKQIK